MANPQGTSLAAFKSAGLPAVDMSVFKTRVAQARQEVARSIGGGLLLRLLKDGMWVYGADNVDVQDGSQWAVNPLSMSMGFAAWGEEGTKDEGTLLGERMALITEPQPELTGLPNVGAAWRPQVSVDLVCVLGDDTGTEVKYKTTSTGGCRAFAGLLAEVSAQLEGGGDAIVPIVELMSDSYQHKKWGKTYVPVFEFIEWKTLTDTTVGEPADGEAADQPQDEVPAQTTSTRRRAAAPAATQEQLPEAQQEQQRQPGPTRRAAAATSQPARRPAVAAVSSGAPATGTAPKAGTVDRGAVVRRRRAS